MFSEIYGYVKNEIQYESMSDKLKQRIWNVFYKYAYFPYDQMEPKMTDIEKMLSETGQPYKIERFFVQRERNVEMLYYYYEQIHWYEVYDFVEVYIKQVIDDNNRESFIKDINRVLEEENAGYRIVGWVISPIINQEEIIEIEKAIFSVYEPVEKHMKKALAYYSNIKQPDYENSIKESISAVESLCCIITGLNGSQSTLGKTLKYLSDNNGVVIHSALADAFNKLYGFTSDQNGIRHGGIDFTGASQAEARFMLVACSAFINYLTANNKG